MVTNHGHASLAIGRSTKIAALPNIITGGPTSIPRSAYSGESRRTQRSSRSTKPTSKSVPTLKRYSQHLSKRILLLTRPVQMPMQKIIRLLTIDGMRSIEEFDFG